uniref:MMPL domain-containing protein n=1 Tax=Angiostrongylus cantonensis TaxID=6313 RepID=A0A0K0DJT9_ANGCA
MFKKRAAHLFRRAIIASYPSFHVLSHHPFEKVPTESAASAPHNFLQTAGSNLTKCFAQPFNSSCLYNLVLEVYECHLFSSKKEKVISVSAIVLMSFLVLLFVMNWEAVISVVISITSICLGIVAYLHLWGVRLDAVSLISILMSVGFSVDYSAHVCYHYFAHATEDQHEHMTERTMVRLSRKMFSVVTYTCTYIHTNTQTRTHTPTQTCPHKPTDTHKLCVR